MWLRIDNDEQKLDETSFAEEYPQESTMHHNAIARIMLERPQKSMVTWNGDLKKKKVSISGPL